MNKKITLSYLTALSLLLPFGAMAQTIDGIACKVVGLVWIIFGVAAIIYFLIYGIMFLMARGDPGKTGEARLGVLYGVVGVVIGVLAFLVVGMIVGFFLPGIPVSVFSC